jgi:hypothetical protein
MMRAAAALAEARKLVDLTEGRYPIAYSPDLISTLIPHTQDARAIATLLSDDALLLRAQDNDPDGALAACRGLLNAGRSVGDEPLLISQLVRVACRAMAAGQAQRVLAQGGPSEGALRQFQQLLEKEEPEPLLLIAVRGERAGADRLMAAVQSGTIRLSVRDLAMTAGLSGARGPSVGESLMQRTPGFLKSQRAAMLRYLNRAVELAQLPPRRGTRPVSAAGRDGERPAGPRAPAGPGPGQAVRRLPAEPRAVALRHSGGSGRALPPRPGPVARHVGRPEGGGLPARGADRSL